MNAQTISRIETNIQRMAAAVFAAAVGYGVHGLAPGPYSQPAYVLSAALVAYVFCNLALKRVGGSRSRLKVPVFDLREFDSLDVDELLLTELAPAELMLTEVYGVAGELILTDFDRLGNARGRISEPLVLDNVLAEDDAGSRVVRLFDRKAMPTPGELSSTIDRHLEGTRVANNDAAQALSEALAELRRSLR